MIREDHYLSGSIGRVIVLALLLLYHGFPGWREDNLGGGIAMRCLIFLQAIYCAEQQIVDCSFLP